MSALATLKTVVVADTASFETGMEKVKAGMGGVAGKVGLLVGGMGVAVAGFGALTVNQFTAAGNAAKKMSDTFGFSAHTASGLTQAAASLNIGGDTLNTGLTILTRTMGNMDLQMDASGHAGKLQTEIFKDLKIKINDVHGAARPLNQVLADVADRFKAMKDGQEKTTIAMKLFGKSAGPELIPFLNQGSAGIAALTAQASKYGAVLSEEDVKASHEFELKTALLHVQITGITTTIGRMLIPVALALAGFISGTVLPALLSLSRWFVSDAKPKIDAFIANAWNPLHEKFTNFKDWVDQHWPEIKSVIMTGLTDIGTIVGDVKTDFEHLSGAVQGLQGNSSALNNTLQPVVASFGFLHEHTKLVARAVEAMTVAYVGYMVVSALLNGALAIQKVALAIHAVALFAIDVLMHPLIAAQLAWNAAISANPIALIVIGIAILIVVIILLVTHWKQVVTWVTNAWNSLGIFRVVIMAALGPVVAFIGAIGLIVANFQNIVTWVGTAIAKIKEFGVAVANSPIGKVIGGAIGVAHALHIPGFAGGIGYVPNTTLAVLHQGERVLTAAQNARGVGGGVGGGQLVVMPVAYGYISPVMQRAIDLDLRDRIRRLDRGQT